MQELLKEGLSFKFDYQVPEQRTVPHLLPESPEFQLMPPVLATGYLVGIIEWACIRALNPHLDWPREQSVGIHLDLSHEAATPPGLEVSVQGRLEKVQGRRLTFSVQAHDGVERICRGFHQRYIIDKARFIKKSQAKAAGRSTP